MMSSFVGVDVSKAGLDVAVLPSEQCWRAKNTAEGVGELVEQLAQLQPALVVLEATGGFERPLVESLQTAGLAVFVAHGWRVRQFARATGKLAKTDKVDARVLARYAQVLQPEPRELPSVFVRELHALVARRAQLLGMQLAEQARLGGVEQLQAVRGSVEAVLGVLAAQRRCVEAEIRRRVRSDSQAFARFQLLTSVPGVGEGLATALLADVPELGHLSRQKIAALVGVAPANDETGVQRRGARIKGGRKDVRGVLYMATLQAVRLNPVIKGAYLRFLARGKPRMVALVACMRKLLVILNAIVRDAAPWQESSLGSAHSGG